jgi:hypothetical protein
MHWLDHHLSEDDRTLAKIQDVCIAMIVVAVAWIVSLFV